MSTKTLAYILVPLWLVSQLGGCIQGRMMEGALGDLERVTHSATLATDHLKRAEEALKNAFAVHNPDYLKKLSLVEAQAAAWNADTELLAAKNADTPEKIREHAQKASSRLNLIRTQSDSVNGYILFLDEALTRFRSEPERLSRLGAVVSNEIHDFTQNQGFFISHFEKARESIDRANVANAHAYGIRETLIWNNLPDYKSVYEFCMLAQKDFDAARAASKAVVALRDENTKGIETLANGLAETRGLYRSALQAGENLERYPRYRMLGDVGRAWPRLSPIDQEIENAQSLNSMATQRFAQAKLELGQVRKTIQEVRACFELAIGTWRRLVAAINQLGDAERDAKAQISSAQSHISSYNHNTQTDAESYVSQAQSKLSTARKIKESDPIESLALFQKAESLAVSAYNSVDTSSRDDDSNSGIGGGFGGWGGGDSSGGGGGFGGGSSGGGTSGGGFGGGSYDSGPSGSYDSGPSGSYDSGPSGSFDGG